MDDSISEQMRLEQSAGRWALAVHALFDSCGYLNNGGRWKNIESAHWWYAVHQKVAMLKVTLESGRSAAFEYSNWGTDDWLEQVRMDLDLCNFGGG